MQTSHRAARQANATAKLTLTTAAAVSAILCVLNSPSADCAAGEGSGKLVVVLYPEANDGSPGSVLADRGLRAALDDGAGGNVEIHNEYLDVSRFAQLEHQQECARFLHRKYSGRKVDVVITGLSSALNFALEHRDDIFPNVPIVFMAVDRQEVEARQLPPDVIGVPVEMDLGNSLAAALRLRPQTERVVVVVGSSKFDAFWEAKARSTFPPAGHQVEVEYLVGLPVEELQTAVGQVPDHTLIYYLHVFEDRDGRVYMPAKVLERLAAGAKAPVFSHVDSYLGRGIVGGRLFSFEKAGKDAGQFGARILAGENPAEIGIQPATGSSYIFDGRQLSRWGIRPASLPPGSEIRYREPTLWDQYKWHFTGLVSLVCLQSVLIAGLLVQRRRRARAERQFRQAVDAAPNGMVLVNASGEIMLVNQQMEKLFGYASDELVGQKVELLLSDPALRRDFFARPEARPVGTGHELLGRRKDGSLFPIEIGLSPLRTEKGLLVLASVIDVSERRRAERQLLEHREELRQLAAQILGAQEMERRRIARELHDDFGQDLALISVELDLLRQRPPTTAAEAQQRIQEMSGRVKQLSSSIHDLSHQLHPMKLEQLGLVAAIRGLCKELSQNHGTRIDFEHDEPPPSLPPEVSLCIYRIAQEALRNVVKHSGAQVASVSLCTLRDTLALEVCDEGRGFDPANVAGQGGLGLVSMRERLRLVDGWLTVQSQTGRGTRLRAEVPLATPNRLAVESSSNASSR